MQQLEVGQSVFVVTCSGHKYNAVVEKIGRKYFYAQGFVKGVKTGDPWKLNLETMEEVCDFLPSKCYFSEDEYKAKAADEKLREELIKSTGKYIQYNKLRDSVTTDQLTRILAILQE